MQEIMKLPKAENQKHTVTRKRYGEGEVPYEAKTEVNNEMSVCLLYIYIYLPLLVRPLSYHKILEARIAEDIP
jgi:hypothetical protein